MTTERSQAVPFGGAILLDGVVGSKVTRTVKVVRRGTQSRRGVRRRRGTWCNTMMRMAARRPRSIGGIEIVIGMCRKGLWFSILRNHDHWQSSSASRRGASVCLSGRLTVVAVRWHSRRLFVCMLVLGGELEGCNRTKTSDRYKVRIQHATSGVISRRNRGSERGGLYVDGRHRSKNGSMAGRFQRQQHRKERTSRKPSRQQQKRSRDSISRDEKREAKPQGARERHSARRARARKGGDEDGGVGGHADILVFSRCASQALADGIVRIGRSTKHLFTTDALLTATLSAVPVFWNLHGIMLCFVGDAACCTLPAVPEPFGPLTSDPWTINQRVDGASWRKTRWERRRFASGHFCIQPSHQVMVWNSRVLLAFHDACVSVFIPYRFRQATHAQIEPMSSAHKFFFHNT